MKIGEFASGHGVSVDTVRYYMELKLIIPEKHGGQYEFAEGCSQDLLEILWLKAADFSLSEIQKIFTLKRFTSLNNEEDIEYYKGLFENKKLALIDRRSEIDEIIDKINLKLMTTETNSKDKRKRLGVPLEILNLLECPKCKQALKLKRATIEENHILEGEFECGCGFNAMIREGIILIPNDYKDPMEDIEIEGHFIEQTSAEYVNLFYESGQWALGKLGLKKLQNAVILEPGTGSGIFLNAILKDIPEAVVYICVDHNYELLKSTKENLETHCGNGRFLFISSDFLNIPIKENCVDIFVDHYATSNYNFHKEGYLIDLMQKLVKPGGKWIGNYFSFKENGKSLRRYPEKTQQYFYYNNIVKALENSVFKRLELKEIGYTEKGGVTETFFIEGDRLYSFVYYGEKSEYI